MDDNYLGAENCRERILRDTKWQECIYTHWKRKDKTGGREEEGEGGQERGRRKGGNDLASINISNHPLHFSFKGL